MAEGVVRPLHLVALGQGGDLLEFFVHRADEAGFRLGQQHAVLRALGTGKRGRDFAEVELQGVGEDGIGRQSGAEQALRLGIGFDERDAGRLAARTGEIGERLLVNREQSAGRAVFRRHVGDRGAIGDRHMV